MIRRALPALLVLAGCTGQNVDEDFIAAHGALLARVVCDGGSVDPILYSAVMFLDGSVLANALENDAGLRVGSWLYERSDAERFGAAVPLVPAQTCPWPGDRFLVMESAELNLYTCQGSPPAPAKTRSMDVDTECTGFNKSLFD